MRTIPAILLIGLVALCPVLCRAADLMIGSDHHAASNDSSCPHPCSETTDNCLCHGAVLSATAGHLPNPDATGLAPLLAFVPDTPRHSIIHLTWNGQPGGIATWGHSLTIRAFLQNFRC